MLAPALNLLCEAWLGQYATQRDRTLLALKQPQRQLGGCDIGVIADRDRILAHCSRHSLSFISPRRTQLFIVPSGTCSRSARSA